MFETHDTRDINPYVLITAVVIALTVSAVEVALIYYQNTLSGVIHFYLSK